MRDSPRNGNRGLESSFHSFGKASYWVTKSKLAFGRDMDSTGVRRQREHHGGVARRVSDDQAVRQSATVRCEQNRAAGGASSRPAGMKCDRQIQLAARRSFLMISGFSERCRRIAHNDPPALVLGDA